MAFEKKTYINTDELIARYLTSVDVEAYALCCSHLSAFRVSKKFHINYHMTPNECENTKLTKSLDALFPSNNVHGAKWFEFLLGGTSHYRTFVLVKLPSTASMSPVKVMSIIQKQIFLASANEVNSKNVTRTNDILTQMTNCGHGKSAKTCKIYEKDWVNFAMLVDSKKRVIEQCEDIQIYMYRCEHELRDRLCASMVEWIKTVHLADIKFIDCVQINIGFSFQGNDEDAAIVLNVNSFETASIQAFPNEELGVFSKFLLKGCSNAVPKRPSSEAEKLKDK